MKLQCALIIGYVKLGYSYNISFLKQGYSVNTFTMEGEKKYPLALSHSVLTNCSERSSSGKGLV